MTGNHRKRKWLPLSGLCLAGLLALAGALMLVNGSARANHQPALAAQVGDEACLACHGQPGKSVPLPNGELLNISIDASHYQASVHGSRDITCTTCHTDISGYPHPPLAAQSLRDVAISMSGVCEKCHNDKFKQSTDSIHHKALVAGNKAAAVCSDCHDPHAQTQLTDLANDVERANVRVGIPQTCAKCHNAIVNEFTKSVHGAALVGSGNLDVPTCIDCHGAHNIADPTTANFRLQSPAICANCHTDKTKMDKYGLSTQVLSTYVSDFHGTTVTLFEKQHPDQATNKPVCFDCHGVHNIVSVKDPQQGLQVKQNVLATCRKCHPGATENFPDSWLSHYIPSPQHYPLVYYVQLFYRFFIPIVVGGMVLYVISDAVRRLINRRKGATHA